MKNDDTNYDTHVSPECWIGLLFRFFPVRHVSIHCHGHCKSYRCSSRTFQNSTMDQHWWSVAKESLHDLLPFASKNLGDLEGLSELTSYTKLLKWHYEHLWIHWIHVYFRYFGAELIDTHWHHLTPGSCALCVASSSFVFPCSPQMRCNFQTAQLGTSFADFAGYCPVTGSLHPDLYWDVYQDRDIGVCFVCIFFAIGPAPLRSFSQLLFLWARPHQRPHLLSLLQSQPVNG